MPKCNGWSESRPEKYKYKNRPKEIQKLDQTLVYALKLNQACVYL